MKMSSKQDISYMKDNNLRFVSVLGKGSQSDVFEVINERYNIKMALKCVRITLASDYEEHRYLMDYTEKLFVKIYGVDRVGGVLYLLLEYLPYTLVDYKRNSMIILPAWIQS